MNTGMKREDSSISLKSSESLGQVLCFVSAKGGTGKTVLSAVTTYALLQSGLRVVAIDTDFSTRGLSLFLLGSVLESQERRIQSKHCLADSILEEIDVHDVTPLSLVRGSLEFNVVISNKDVWRGGVPDERFLGGSPASPEKRANPTDYFEYLKKLCERFRKEYDYVVMDTRGGYDFTSAAPATIADGYIIVLEADRVSVEQVSGFKKKIDGYASSLDLVYPDSPAAVLKGFIVNKALFSVDDKVFPDALAREYDSKTFGVIPIDKDVIRAYQKKNIPQETFPDSDFSYQSLVTIEHFISPSLNWQSAEHVGRFSKFLAYIRSQWQARRRAEFAQHALVPAFLISFAVLSAILYLFFKRSSAGYSLPAFYVSSTIFVLLSAISAMLGTLSFMRAKEVATRTRKIAATGFVVLLLGLFYLTWLDVPKTFSQAPLLQRIRERDQTIATQEEKVIELSGINSGLRAENDFVTADRENLKIALDKSLEQINQLQTDSASVRVQLSSVKRDRDAAQSALANTEQQAQSLRQLVSDCQRKCR